MTRAHVSVLLSAALAAHGRATSELAAVSVRAVPKWSPACSAIAKPQDASDRLPDTFCDRAPSGPRGYAAACSITAVLQSSTRARPSALRRRPLAAVVPRN